MVNNQNNDKDIVRLQELQRRRLRERIEHDRKVFFEKLTEDFIKKPAPGQTLEEKESNKRRLLNYVHRYVFLQKLQPVESNLNEISRVTFETSRIRSFFRVFLVIRSFCSSFLQVRAFFLFFSAILFFSIEYILKYVFHISWVDVNISFEDVIRKIPPFC
jgi:hypothetical protein